MISDSGWTGIDSKCFTNWDFPWFSQFLVKLKRVFPFGEGVLRVIGEYIF